MHSLLSKQPMGKHCTRGFPWRVSGQEHTARWCSVEHLACIPQRFLKQGSTQWNRSHARWLGQSSSCVHSSASICFQKFCRILLVKAYFWSIGYARFQRNPRDIDITPCDRWLRKWRWLHTDFLAHCMDRGRIRSGKICQGDNQSRIYIRPIELRTKIYFRASYKAFAKYFVKIPFLHSL